MILYKKYQTGGTYVTYDRDKLPELEAMQADSAIVDTYLNTLGNKIKTGLENGSITPAEAIQIQKDNKLKEQNIIIPAIKRKENYNKQPFKLGPGEVKQPKKVIYKEKPVEQKNKIEINSLPLKEVKIINIPFNKQLTEPSVSKNTTTIPSESQAVYNYVTVIYTDAEGKRHVKREKNTIPYAWKVDGTWVLNPEAKNVIFKNTEQ